MVDLLKKCPHCDKPLKLIADSQRMKGTTVVYSSKYRCPVQGCGYTYSDSETVENLEGPPD
jgi:hypothetical protein